METENKSNRNRRTNPAPWFAAAAVIVAAVIGISLFGGRNSAEQEPEPSLAPVPAATAAPSPVPTPSPEPTPEPVREIELYGLRFTEQDTRLDLSCLQTLDPAELFAAAPEFSQVEEIDLSGCTLPPETIAALREVYVGAVVRCTTRVGEVTCDSMTEELDFTDGELTLEQAELACRAMPMLKTLIMPEKCGYADEDISALNDAYPETRIIWTLHFCGYVLRTDATMFCASNVPGYVAVKMTDEDLVPLRYCVDMEALDLGHMYYTDLSFLENMPHLKYLILVEARYQDVSAIAKLQELYYLELFNNTIGDISPLLECRALRHLNIGYTRGFDPAPLWEMTWLERLWYPANTMSQSQRDDLTAALPDTQCYLISYDGKGSTGGGWREGEVYTTMRDVFSMFYQPGGTGVK